MRNILLYKHHANEVRGVPRWGGKPPTQLRGYGETTLTLTSLRYVVTHYPPRGNELPRNENESYAFWAITYVVMRGLSLVPPLRGPSD